MAVSLPGSSAEGTCPILWRLYLPKAWREDAERATEWLLVEWPKESKAPTKYGLAQLGPPPGGWRRWLRMAKARWRVELDYRELQEELGLDHYQGRQWLGGHHHVCLVSIAYAFLRSAQARRKQNTLPEVRKRLQVILLRLLGHCPWCQSRFEDASQLLNLVLLKGSAPCRPLLSCVGGNGFWFTADLEKLPFNLPRHLLGIGNKVVPRDEEGKAQPKLGAIQRIAGHDLKEVFPVGSSVGGF